MEQKRGLSNKNETNSSNDLRDNTKQPPIALLPSLKSQSELNNSAEFMGHPSMVSKDMEMEANRQRWEEEAKREIRGDLPHSVLFFNNFCAYCSI